MQWSDGLVCDPEIEVEVAVASNGDEFVGVLAVDHLEDFTLSVNKLTCSRFRRLILPPLDIIILYLFLFSF